ncbi:hypothetical protein LTR08_002160 [Meristemomyces frigidus]|nr:hypothetical protein LTR08_002160 [Meristemomyces frigidus]
MGWFWDDKKPDGSAVDDPYSKLDPALRTFLEKESPLKYADTLPSSRAKAQEPTSNAGPSAGDAASSTYRSQLGWTEPDTTTPHASSNKPDEVPPESLYQDGRYAHLWKGYRPQGEIDAAGRNDADKLRDVIDSYNDRRAAIGRAAIENCVMEQMAERDCWENGSWQERMSMCKGRNKEFMRCYTMQARFLKALGFMSRMDVDGTGGEEERVQMHADKLYHEMLDREQAAAAKAAGGASVVEEALPPLISVESTTAALGTDSAWARARQKAVESGGEGVLSVLSPQRQEAIRQQMEGMNARERELELQLVAAETRSQVEYAEQIRERMDEERVGRLERRGRGKETVGDTIKRLWGWDKDV